MSKKIDFMEITDMFKHGLLSFLGFILRKKYKREMKKDNILCIEFLDYKNILLMTAETAE